MPESDPPMPAERSDATGSWRPAPAGPTEPDPNPTVITTGSTGRRAIRSEAAGASSHRGSSLARGDRPAASLPMPEPGDRLESFELHEPIGVGGMGAVFLASDTRLHRQVALKILPPEQSGDPEVVQRFYQEGRAAARLDHENIARVYTIGADRGYHFIAFEYIAGTTVRQRVEQHGPLTVGEAINYTLQIASALVHASERGVVHRDIKPSNIIVTPNGRAKLVDMGLARRFERGAADDGLTQSGMTLGTFDYISPEQARDPRDVDVRSDLYSLGCTMYHMLTGRPPFPEGTVLQKLLQHQEEPAPDVRRANPEVPADLAAVILKLMEKDRDRRYQSPEQLSRDLIGLAGALGLRSVSPEGLVWMNNRPAPSWERHLIWAVPATALVMLIGALIWWGQPPPSAIEATGGGPRILTDREAASSPRSSPPRLISPGPEGPSRSTSLGPTTAESDAAAPPLKAPPIREIAVGSNEDLAARIATATAGATILLTDDGPYDVRPVAWSRPESAGIRVGDLTIRAEPGSRPAIRASLERSAAVDLALLHLRGGRVRIEGIDFLLDPSSRGESLTAIVAEGTELSLGDCRFRRLRPGPDQAPPTALYLRPDARGPSADDGEAPRSVRIASSHFDGGQVGIRSRGAVELHLRDCTFGPADPAIWLDNAGAGSIVPVGLTLRSLLVQAGEGPVVRSAGTDLYVTLADSVIAPLGRGRGILLAIDDPTRFDWDGRDNVYGRIATYLLPTAPSSASPITDFSGWADDPVTIRETRSEPTGEMVWASDQPARPDVTESVDPSEGFRLAPDALADVAATESRSTTRARPVAGAVLGRLLARALSLRAQRPAATPSRPETDRPGAAGSPKFDARASDLALSDRPKAAVAATPATIPPVIGLDPEMTPMPAAPAVDDGDLAPSLPDGPMPIITEEVPPPSSSPGSDQADPESARIRVPDGPAERSRGPLGVGLEPEDRPNPVEPAASAAASARDLRRSMARIGQRGGTISIAAGARIELSEIDLPRNGRWVLQAGPGSPRPVLRFRPEEDGFAMEPEPSVLFRMASGSALELRGIDLVLERPSTPGRVRGAAFDMGTGTDLVLDRCTVTIEGLEARGRADRNASLVILPEPEPDFFGLNDSSASSIQLTESLIRAAGDVVDLSGDRRLDLTLGQSVVACGGSLLHANGQVRAADGESISLGLRQVTARALGGLIRLETSARRPEPPRVEVVARDSILATDDAGRPLVRVSGQGDLDSLRDRVRWEGRGVLYHRIEVYRRDESSTAGEAPLDFRRDFWQVAVGARDPGAVHADAGFIDPWSEETPLWSLGPADFRLGADAPAPDVGADVSRVARPPESRTD